MIEDIHTVPHCPHVSCLAGIPSVSAELVLRCPEARSSSAEITFVIVRAVSDCGKVYDFDLVSYTASLTAYQVVHLDITVSYIVIVEVFDSLTYLYKQQTSNISHTAYLELVS